MQKNISIFFKKMLQKNLTFSKIYVEFLDRFWYTVIIYDAIVPNMDISPRIMGIV